MMKAQINLITIWTEDIERMKNFIIKFLVLRLKVTWAVMWNSKMRESDLLYA